MNVEKIAFTDLNFLPKLIVDYLNESSSLAHLYDFKVNIESFKDVITYRQKTPAFRNLLVQELTKQYIEIEQSELVKQNILSIKDANTFTVTTAHQLCLFTGPLYFIYKIISTIKLSQQLKEAYPNYHFVPVFWLGSEDHDVAEINHLHLNEKTISWQNNQTGAVGKMNNAHLKMAVDELLKWGFYQNKNTHYEKIVSFFKEENNYTKSFIQYINYLFGTYGLVILDQDNTVLKNAFNEVLQRELFDDLVIKSSEKSTQFLKENYTVQATPRDINLFYMKDNIRERIVKKNNEFHVLNTDIVFDEKQLKNELHLHPEYFSPNVLLRPLYQEFILPNLAYIGGAGELSYWLQLKDVFHANQLKMPMLILRDSALIISAKSARFCKEIGLDKKCLFKNKQLLINDLIKTHSTENLSLVSEEEMLNKAFENLQIKATNVDKSLEKYVASLLQNSKNNLADLSLKMRRAEKKKHEVMLRRLDYILSEIYPQNTLQERYQNFITFYETEPQFQFDFLLQNFDPLSKQFSFFSLE